MRSALVPARPRAVALLVITALVAGLLAVVGAAPTARAADDPQLGLSAAATRSVLSGAGATVTLTARNHSDAPRYNIGYSYVLPEGVTISGEATSGGVRIGPPTSTVTLTDGSTLVVFANVSDLMADDQKAIVFTVVASAQSYPVGSVFGGRAKLAASTEARTTPTFDTSTDPSLAGTPTPTSTVRTASATANATSISAIRVEKAEASPEHELVRGVHDQATTYSVTVTNTDTAATTGVTVTDLLPAGLEFLGCGDVDNTTTGPEYPGAPSLAAGPTLAAADCPQPVTVRTRDDAAGQEGQVVTEVVWDLGDLAPGAATTIAYRAAVPLFENTMTYRSGSATAPAASAPALSAAANLDNNTGPSTRQAGPSGAADRSNGQGLTNTVTASGTYAGAVAVGGTAAQTASTTRSVEAMDLAVAKSVDTDPSASGGQRDFRTGQVAAYRLLVRASEYERSTGLVFTDTLPNGLCPVFPAATPTTGSFPAECDPTASGSETDGAVVAATTDGSSDVPVSVDAVAYDADAGTFTMTLSVAEVPANGSVAIRYGALMRTTYSSTASAGPTAAGDAFTNEVRLRATSHALDGRGDTGTRTVVDDSAATVTSGAPRIDKTVLARPAGGTTIADASQCAAQSGYGDAAPTYGLGDTVCFRLAVTFPAGVQSHNATITDMLPTGTTIGNGWTEGTDWVVGPAAEGSVNPAVTLQSGSSSTTATFSLGSTVPGASGTYVDGTKTRSVVLYVVARVTQQGSSATKPDITANLMKYAQQDTAGKVTSLRDQADYRVAGAPTTTVAKTVQVVGSSAAPATNAQGVREGQTLQYRLRFTNAASSPSTVSAATVWDALPAGITCADNAVTVPSGEPARCADAAPGAVDPAYAGRQFVVWAVPSTAPGATVDLTYPITRPAQALVGTAYANTASIVRFTTATTTPDVSTTWVPAPATAPFRSVHTTAADRAGGEGVAPNAATTARSTATIAQLGVAKTGGAVPAATNRQGSTAVPGQGLQYTYRGTVPAHTTAGRAVLADSLPSGIETTPDTVWSLTLPGATAPAVTRTVTDGDASVDFGGQSFTFTGGATNPRAGGTLTFPVTFDNTGDTDLTFSVTVTGLRVGAGVSATNTANTTYNGGNVTNIATFTAKNPTGASTSSRSTTATVNVQAAALGIVAQHVPDRAVTGADEVQWTLTARNASATTEARSVIIADCLPDAFEYLRSSAPVATLSEAQRAAVACDTAGTTPYSWELASPVAPNGTAVVTVTGRLGDNASATSTFRNTAVVLQSSLDTDYATTGRSYVQRVTTTDDVAVAAPTVTKTLTAPGWDPTTGAASAADATPARTVRAGDTGAYTITATVPAAVALHDGVVSDVLPDGVVPAGEPTARVVVGSGVTATPAYDRSTRTVTVTLSDVAADQADGVRVVVTVPVRIGSGVDAGTPVRNTAALSWDRTLGQETTRASVTSEASTTTVVAPNLGITKAVTASSGGTGAFVTALPGDALRYTVRVTNTGGSPAYGTDVVDCVPAGVVIDRGSIGDEGTYDPAPDGGCDGGTITWSGLTVGTATTTEFRYDAVLAAGSDLDGTARDNTVRVTTYRSLPAPAGDAYAPVIAGAKVTPTFPRVAVTKTNDTAGGLSYVGRSSDFTVSMTNTGSRASATSARDELPAGWTYDAGSATVSRDGGAATTPVEPRVDGRVLVWSGLGPLGASERLTLRYRATPGESVVTGSDTEHVNHVVVTVEDPTGSTAYDGGKGSFVTYPEADDGTRGTDATASARIDRADLVIAKTATSADVVAGATTPNAWTIRVSNRAGADPARGTTVVDRPELPAGATMTLAADSAAAGWTCTVADGTWTCANGAVVTAGDAFPALSFDLALRPDAPLTAIPNTAAVEQRPGQTADGGAGSTVSARVTPTAVADLVMHKETAQRTVVAGAPLSWELSVENRVDPGREAVSDARGAVRVTDTLPDTVTLQRVTVAEGSGWTCETGDRTVTCERDGLASGTTAGGIVVTAVVHPDLRAGTVVQNRATTSVDGPTTDPRSDDDTSAPTETTVTDDTTLALHKAFTGELVAGRDAAWTITVENTGTADARDVVVRDELERGTALVDGRWTGDAWTCTGTTAVVCELDGTLRGGASTRLTLPVTTPSSLDGPLGNTAVATWSNRAARVTDVQDSASSTEAGRTVGLRVTKRVAAPTVDAGADTSYTIEVANPDGPSDLPAGDAAQPALTVVDQLPDGFAFTGLSAASAQHWKAAAAPDGTVTLTSTEGIALGEAAPPIDLLVHVAADHPVGAVTNRVVVTPGTAPGADARNDADVVVTAHADLAVTKTRTSAATADAGTDVAYDVTVRNDGPSDAHRVTWRDLAPAGMTVTRVTTEADGWEQAADGPARWAATSLAAGSEATFHVTAAVRSDTPAGTLTNTATVTSATPDTDPSDDAAAAEVGVTTHALLRLTKTPVAEVGSTTAAERVTAGSQQVWLLRVRNEGPSDERPTTVVTDLLPEGMRFVAASSEGAAWTCDGTTDTRAVTCALPDTVVAGSEAPALWVTTAIASSYTGTTIANTASVTGQGTPAPTGSDATPSTSRIAVDRVANLTVAIGHRGATAIGRDLRGTIRVRNGGPSDATDVRVAYTLPDGLGYESADTGDAWTVGSVIRHRGGATTVTFVMTGAIAAGTSAPPIAVHQTPTAAAYPRVEPTATVRTSTTETTTADNDDADAVAVAASSDLSVTKTHLGSLVRGATVGYTVTVRNDGRTEDPGPVVVTDALPDGLTLVSVDDAGAATCATGRTVTCTLAEPLATGSEVALQITVRVDRDAPDRITNVATVATPTAQAAADGAPARPHDAMRASDPAPVQSAPREAALASTGAVGLGIGSVLALLAMLAGAVLLLVARRRRRA